MSGLGEKVQKAMTDLTKGMTKLPMCGDLCLLLQFLQLYWLQDVLAAGDSCRHLLPYHLLSLFVCAKSCFRL